MESINIINAATARNVDVGINNKHVQVSRFEQYSYGHVTTNIHREKSRRPRADRIHLLQGRWFPYLEGMKKAVV